MERDRERVRQMPTQALPHQRAEQLASTSSAMYCHTARYLIDRGCLPHPGRGTLALPCSRPMRADARRGLLPLHGSLRRGLRRPPEGHGATRESVCGAGRIAREEREITPKIERLPGSWPGRPPLASPQQSLACHGLPACAGLARCLPRCRCLSRGNALTARMSKRSGALASCPDAS
jgi:hypothetical protein